MVKSFSKEKRGLMRSHGRSFIMGVVVLSDCDEFSLVVLRHITIYLE